MCRHLAYLGPPVALSDLILDPPHGLLHQSYAPVDMRGGGTVNADGFGVGWYPVDGVGPVRYRRSVPIWADESLPGLLASTRAGAVLAAVRNGTTGMPALEQANAPFTGGPWLFSHNGRLPGWPESGAALAGLLPLTDVVTLDAPTDSALLWALVRRRLSGGATLAEALVAVVAETIAADPAARLNLLLTDGETVAATAWWHSLWVRRTDDSVLVCSEPLTQPDTSGWDEVPDRHLVIAGRAGFEIRPIEGGRKEGAP